MRHLRLAVFCTAGLLLAGCQPTREQLAMQASQDDATCKSYGARPGTESMVNCRVALMQTREAERRRKAAAIDALTDAYIMGVATAPRQPIATAPKTCSSVPNGVGGSNITCF